MPCRVQLITEGTKCSSILAMFLSLHRNIVVFLLSMTCEEMFTGGMAIVEPFNFNKWLTQVSVSFYFLTVHRMLSFHLENEDYGVFHRNVNVMKFKSMTITVSLSNKYHQHFPDFVVLVIQLLCYIIFMRKMRHNTKPAKYNPKIHIIIYEKLI